MSSLTELINNLGENVRYLVVIDERNSWVFAENDEISELWANEFEVAEVISEANNNVIVRVTDEHYL